MIAAYRWVADKTYSTFLERGKFEHLEPILEQRSEMPIMRRLPPAMGASAQLRRGPTTLLQRQWATTRARNDVRDNGDEGSRSQWPTKELDHPC